MPLIVQSSSTRPTTGRGRFRDPKTGKFQTGSLEKCPKCGSDTRIVNTRWAKKTGSFTRRCHCKSCGQKFVAVVGIRPSDINPNYRRTVQQQKSANRHSNACKNCEHWWGGRCEKGQTVASCTSYESSL